MGLFKKRVSAQEFGEGLWVAVSHAIKKFTMHNWNDYEKVQGVPLPSEAIFARFAIETLVLHLWIAGRALGSQKQESLDHLTQTVATFLSEKMSVNDPHELITQRFKQYHDLTDKNNGQELGFQICENLYSVNMVNLAPLDSMTPMIMPMTMLSYINSMMQAFKDIENKFVIFG